ncbi:MAG: cadherin-like domain-containing protein [Betaproteobacteria bacterium]|nr:cadherin-like domain-containing protein [Betaproteobacteria bacterium]
MTSTITVTPVNDAPVLTNNPITYAAPGNTQLLVAGATLPGVASVSDPQSALTKAVPTDVDSPGPFTVVAASGSSANGGSYVMNSNGSFTFVPPVGFTGTDLFTYQVTDGTTPTTGTINITVGQRVWYIKDATDANNPVGGDGRSNNAFDNIAAFNAATTNNGDIIFVFNGNSGTTPLAGGFTLKDGQKLWGEGIGLTVSGFGTLVPAGTKPKINNAAGDAVSVPATAGNRQNVEIRGLSLAASGNAVDVTASGANLVGITISDNDITAAGLEGIDLNAGSTGAFAVTAGNNSIAATGAGFSAVTSAATTMTVDFSNNAVGSGATGVQIDGSGGGTTTITGFSNNTVSGNNVGTGIAITSARFDATTGGSYQQVSGGTTVIGASGNGVGGAGLVLTNITGDLGFTDLDVFADGGAAVRQRHGRGQSRRRNGHAGDRRGRCGHLRGDRRAGSGRHQRDDQSAADEHQEHQQPHHRGGAQQRERDVFGGLRQQHQQHYQRRRYRLPGRHQQRHGELWRHHQYDDRKRRLADRQFRDDELHRHLDAEHRRQSGVHGNGRRHGHLDRPGQHADDDHGHRAERRQHDHRRGRTEIPEHLGERRGQGIVLNATGAGALTVSGTGTTDGSGGTIQNISTRGAELISASNITLKNMNFTNANTTDGGTCTDLSTAACNAAIYLSSVSTITLDNINVTGTTAQQAINGITVSNFTLSNSTLANCGTSGTVEEGCIKMRELTGTSAITNSSLTFPAQDVVEIVNTTGSLTLDVTGSTLSDSQSSTAGGNGLQVRAQGTANIVLDVTNNSFLRLRTNGLHATAINTATNDVDVTGNTFDPGTGTMIGIDLDADNTGTLKFNVVNNPKIWSRNGPAVNVFGDTNANINGRINDNPDVQVKSNVGSNVGSGIRANVNKDASAKIEIKNNVVNVGSDDAGIDLTGIGKTAANPGGGTNTLDATVTGNNVTIGATSTYGVVILSATNAGDTNAVCVNVGTNAITRNPASIASFRARVPSVSGFFRMQGFATNPEATWNGAGNTPTSAGGSEVSYGGSGTFAACSTALPTNPTSN